MTELSRHDRVFLAELSHLYPTVDAAATTIASLEASLDRPKPTVHVISDIHGEAKKLKHVVNNASGSLRPLVERLFYTSLDEADRRELLNLIYYPRETFEFIAPRMQVPEVRREYVQRRLEQMLVILRHLAAHYPLGHTEQLIPREYRELLRELLFLPRLEGGSPHLGAVVRQFHVLGKELDLVRVVARMVRNLLIGELIVAGDCGDRGPRIDQVIEFLMRQPNVSIVWGNHDMSWLAACLGHELSIATVLRVSLRYRRLSQLEEGYGIPMVPLERLVRDCYADDPAVRFSCKGAGLRDPQLMARMQKAIAIIQFKLEGQFIKRNPHLNLEQRDLLGRMSLKNGTVPLEDGKEYPLLDTHFPTVNPADPLALSPEEASCMARLRSSFLHSPILWEQMKFLVRRGRMHLVRDRHLIFHGCLPVTPTGEYQTLRVDGEELAGKRLFEKLNDVVSRALLGKAPEDLDLLWYLWGGPLSPLFGKDKMATFETYFIADEHTHKETKNPYFSLIHEKEFCRKILREFDVDDVEGLIVNGHVPVKIAAGESPLKKSGMAVTIDGAFSEAYGDKGYTLILEPRQTLLALHHHFESVEEAIQSGADIIPSVQILREYAEPRRVAVTEQGEQIRGRVEVLRQLIDAYNGNDLNR
ncbi:MAG: fructose-1,6-bisphosphatase [Planctomycetes bacterium]|nr:fructose-1,6-bisphosphatase [Planctomycetota bacterium]